MTTRLERRYRALLRVLPRSYRAQREEEMVASFLDGRPGDLDGEYGWPGWPETAATVGLAVRTRVGDGDAVRTAGLFGLLLGIAMAAAAATAGGLDEPLWLLAHAASAAALVAAVRGAAVEARLLAAVPVLVGFLPLAMAFGPGEAPWQPALRATFLLPAVITLLALCATTPKASPRWLWAAVGAAAVGALLPLVGLDPLTCAPFALLLAVRRTTAVAIAALALLPYAVLSALLPGGPPLWPLAAFAALAVALGVRRAAAG